MADGSDRFPRLVGETPRAAYGCYGAAVLHAATAAAVGLIEGSARDIAIGFLVAFFGAVLWCAIGTAVALLAHVADGARPLAPHVEREVVVERLLD